MANTDEEFDDWYRPLHPQLVSVVVASFGDLQLARDAASEAGVRAYERWDAVQGMSSPSGWAIRVALNDAKRRTRRRAVEKRLLLQRRPVASIDGPAGELWHVVAELPARQRQAVALRHVTQMTEAEIAEVMGITRGGVSSTLRAAYAALRTAIADEEGTPADA